MKRLLADADVRVDVEDHERMDALAAAMSQYHFEVGRLLRARRFGLRYDPGIFTEPWLFGSLFLFYIIVQHRSSMMDPFP